MIGEREEHVVEGGLATVEVDGVDAVGVERTHHFHEARAFDDRDRGDESIGVEGRRVRRERLRRARDARRARSADRDRHVDALGADPRLQLGGRAVRDRAAVVEHDDVVGELIGLFEVLRREDDRGAVAHEVAEHLPEVVAAARVETGGGLVEEQHARVGDEARREVEAAAHAARERLHEPVATRRRGRAARAARRPGRRACCLREVVQATDHHEVLAGAHQPVDRGLLGRDPDALAHGERVARTTSSPATRRRALGGLRQRGEDADRRGLARAVVAEQPEDRAGGHVEVEIPQRPEVAVALASGRGP